ncbi:MAG: DUF1622 domain-containing protein [Acetobacteraceae bacterium]|nr:DUF1622 domain-containing protein [Acetobacteraceae bacterium]
MAGEWVVDLAARWAALGFEAAGVAAIVLVSFAATLRYVRASRKVGDWLGGLAGYRADLGRGVLLGLEMLVAADILGTIAASPSLETLGVLALVILIRIVLSVSLNVEVDGAWPWRRRCREPHDAAGTEA